MNNQVENTPNYGSWVSRKLLFGTIFLGLIFLGVSFLHPGFIILSVFFMSAFGYFLYARIQFSPRGANLQQRIRDMVLEFLNWNGQGKALDIGCGNGPLVIKMAKKFTGARIIGIDQWGIGWDYSLSECEKNADLEGVREQVRFEKASASSLPYEDEYFDAVVSNFVFHEVNDTKDKKELLREALRVLKKGGAFSFQDLFLVKNFYGEKEKLLEMIKSWGVQDVKLVETNKLDFIPGVLKLPFMVGEIGIIHGTK
jgi:SAM-dependent methyltransferase